jgi:hypothetical protein
MAATPVGLPPEPEAGQVDAVFDEVLANRSPEVVVAPAADERGTAPSFAAADDLSGRR